MEFARSAARFKMEFARSAARLEILLILMLALSFAAKNSNWFLQLRS